MKLYSYNIPLSPSGQREGIILKTDGGWGEIAPLPGWSSDTLEEAIESIHTAPTSAAWFGLSCVKTPWKSAFPEISISALASTIEDAEAAVKNGYRTIKLKVGSLLPSSAIAFVKSVQDLGVSLRIDVNRRWTKQQALYFFERVDPKGIEYVEEPVSNPDDLQDLGHLPIALDETLKDSVNLNVQAFVLKPTILGERLNMLIELGKKHKKKLIFSSSYETGIGLLHIAHLQATHAPNLAVGLDTYRAFTQHLLPISVKKGILCSDPLPPVDQSLLRLI